MSMDPPPPVLPSNGAPSDGLAHPHVSRSESFSAKSDNSQTAADFIRDQIQMEADAREAMPYSISNCTNILGPLKQSVFACLTCNPPPPNPNDPYQAAGACYACSVQCHGEHTLVEIFNKRNFTCDCGTTNFPATSPCSLRFNEETKAKGGVHSQEPDANNKYNLNFRNRFCGCKCDYDPFQQKGTMFQCLGLGTHEAGGCGEDWYHPGCLVGLGPKWFEDMMPATKTNGHDERRSLPTISEDAEQPANGDVPPAGAEAAPEDDELPLPPGFPAEEEFDGFICYKCVDAHPWIKKYAGSPGFLPALFTHQEKAQEAAAETAAAASPKKRKAEDDMEDTNESKRLKDGNDGNNGVASTADEAADLPSPETKEAEMADASSCKYALLPPAPQGQFSLFLKDDFRDHLCRCAACYRNLDPHPQLLEEEEVYEPPLSSDGGSAGGGASTHGSGSLLERGESALRNVDRVRAIEGVMAYNHLKDKLKPFFQQFAESGRAISADDVKDYFAKLRGDEQAIRDAGEGAARARDGDDEDGSGGDSRREQSGY